MYTIRPTQKLRRRVLDLIDTELSPPTTRLGDWYANLVVHHRRQVVLFVSERTLLPVVVPAAPVATLIPRFRHGLGELLEAVGIAAAGIEDELKTMGVHAVGKTSNRRVLGSMNDFAWLLDAAPEDETLLNAARVMADAPCSPIGMESSRAVTVALFASRDAGGLAG
jgi:hypothetical protein